MKRRRFSAEFKRKVVLEAMRVIASWLDHYNHRRPHLALAGRTQAEAYAAGGKTASLEAAA